MKALVASSALSAGLLALFLFLHEPVDARRSAVAAAAVPVE
jgi:hypothetical protein